MCRAENAGVLESIATSEFLDAIPTPVFVKDVAGRFIGVNREYETFTGITRDRILGKTVHDVHPADLADRYAAADAALYERGEEQIYEAPIVSAGRGRRDVVVTKRVLADRGGLAVGLIGAFVDVTERRDAERVLRDANRLLGERVAERTTELARANSLLTATLESSTDGILAIDAAGRVASFNARFLRMWGLEASDVEGGDAHELLALMLDRVRDRDDHARRVEAQRAAPDQQLVDRVELHDGRVFERYSMPLVAPGHRGGRVWSFRDVTRERHLEAEMRHAQKMEALGRLAGGVAHDFNNLLTVIFGSLELAMTTLPAATPAHEDLLEVNKAAQRASDLTRQLLAFSRKQVLAPRAVRLDELLEGMHRMLQRVLGEHIAIEVMGDPDLGWVVGDPGQLEQVVANLCVNARDAMPDGGTVKLVTRNTSGAEFGGPARFAHGAVELVVSDTGVGMSAEVRERIFEPFFTTKEHGKGTGLGLSTVFGIVSQAGGAIDVRSAPGCGTTFRIVLPRGEGEMPLDPVPGGASPVPLADSRSILLVEDEPALRRVLVRELCAAGYVVAEACDGVDALEVASRQEQPFDLLVTDVLMPRKSGVALARELTAGGRVRGVLFISGYAEGAGEIPRNATVLAKPFHSQKLLGAVDALIGRPAPRT